MIEANGCAFLREGGGHTVYFKRPRKKCPRFLGIAHASAMLERLMNVFYYSALCRENELETDYLDLLYLHAPDPSVQIEDSTGEFAQRQGRPERSVSNLGCVGVVSAMCPGK